MNTLKLAEKPRHKKPLCAHMRIATIPDAHPREKAGHGHILVIGAGPHPRPCERCAVLHDSSCHSSGRSKCAWLSQPPSRIAEGAPATHLSAAKIPGQSGNHKHTHSIKEVLAHSTWSNTHKCPPRNGPRQRTHSVYKGNYDASDRQPVGQHHQTFPGP